MGMSSTPAPPPAPDPYASANAQAGLNQQTAMTQQQLNMVDQYTPYGSLTYKRVDDWGGGSSGGSRSPVPASSPLSTTSMGGRGASALLDAAGLTDQFNGGGSSGGGGVPHYAAYTSLTPEQQAIFNTNQQTQGNIANIGRDQSARIGDLLGKPLQLGNEATEARLMDLGMRRLSPQFARDEETLRTRLANSGIKEGSAAWNAEMTRNSQAKNDALDQLLLSGRSQANNEIMAERNQPINEITALMSGSQVSNPTFANTPQTQVGGVDLMGAINNNYNAQVQQQKIAQEGNNAAMGGLFGLAGAGIGAAAKVAPYAMMFSDRRLKDGIRKVGKLDNGLPVYAFRYKGSDTPQIGLMADEVERVHPGAVATHASGYKMVDYAQAVEA